MIQADPHFQAQFKFPPRAAIHAAWMRLRVKAATEGLTARERVAQAFLAWQLIVPPDRRRSPRKKTNGDAAETHLSK